MHRFALSAFIFWISFTASSQSDFKGLILDEKSGNPIPYVNIGILERGVGTVSDERGEFQLFMDPSRFNPGDILQISSLGYKSVNISLSEVPLGSANLVKYLLSPQPLELEEVVVTSAGGYRTTEEVGYSSGSRKNYGYWKDNIALGGELATLIRVSKGLRKLDEFTFEVLGNTADSVLIRLNFYDTDGKKGGPGTNLNRSGMNILSAIGREAGQIKIPLTDYDVYVRDDFVASLELVKVFGSGSIGLVLAAADEQHVNSYKKYASKDEWKILDNAAMAYKIRSSVYTEKPSRAELRKIKLNEARPSISGYVLNGSIPLADVEIYNITTGFDTRTNAKGHYQIKADKGDILRLSARGFPELKITILDKKFVNINLAN